MTAATHWARVVAQTFTPSREQLVTQALQRIEDEPDGIEPLAELIRQAHGQPPLPPKHERIAAERIRLEAMTTDEILAERAEEERQLRELVEQAKAESAAEEERIKAYYGGTPATPGTKIHGDLSDSPEGFLVAE